MRTFSSLDLIYWVMQLFCYSNLFYLYMYYVFVMFDHYIYNLNFKNVFVKL